MESSRFEVGLIHTRWKQWKLSVSHQERGLSSSHERDLQLFKFVLLLPKAFPSTRVHTLSLHWHRQLCQLKTGSLSQTSRIYLRKSSIWNTFVIRLKTNATPEYYQEYNNRRLLGKPKCINVSLERQIVL